MGQASPGRFEQGFAVGILPMNRLPGSPRLRASAAILYFVVFWITDDSRLEREFQEGVEPSCCRRQDLTLLCLPFHHWNKI